MLASAIDVLSVSDFYHSDDALRIGFFIGRPPERDVRSEKLVRIVQGYLTIAHDPSQETSADSSPGVHSYDRASAIGEVEKKVAPEALLLTIRHQRLSVSAYLRDRHR
jgi:hypothetical protein